MTLQLIANKDIEKNLDSLPAKHFKQIWLKVLKLLNHPYPQDYKKITINQTDYCRVDAGEYRIIYKVEQDKFYLILIDKRNDGEVYKVLKRKT